MNGARLPPSSVPRVEHGPDVAPDVAPDVRGTAGSVWWTGLGDIFFSVAPVCTGDKDNWMIEAPVDTHRTS